MPMRRTAFTIAAASAALLACSEPEPPECAEYRAAEVRASVALKESEAVADQVTARLEELKPEREELAAAWLSENAKERKAREERNLSNFSENYDAQRKAERAQEAIDGRIEAIDEVEKLASRAVGDVAAKLGSLTEAVAIRASQGCSAPKPVFEDEE